MADNGLVDVRAPEPTLDYPHHKPALSSSAHHQQNQATPAAAAFVAALSADSLADDDDDAFQEFAMAPAPLVSNPVVPMPVEGGVHEEEGPKEQEEEGQEEEEGGLHFSDDIAALADQREWPLRKEEELAAFAPLHGEQEVQALETSSSAPPAPVVCPHVGQEGEGQELELEQEQEEKKGEEEEIRVPLAHMELLSSGEGRGDEAAESSLAATEEKAGALLSFNPDLLLADMQFQSTMTWEEEGGGVPSLSPPGSLPSSAIEEQAAAFLTGTMTTQDEAPEPETSNKDLLDDDDGFGEFATLPAEDTAAVPEAQEEEEGREGPEALTLERKGIAATAAAPFPSLPPAPLPSVMIEEENVDDDDEDDYGDFAEAEFVSCVPASPNPLPAPDAAPLLFPTPTPPMTTVPAHHQQTSSSSSGPASPLPSSSSSSGPLKRDARTLFEECFGGAGATAVPVVLPVTTTKRRAALQELRVVDLQQGLCFNRPFPVGARPWSWSDDVLATVLRPSGSCTAHRRRRHQKQQQPQVEEQEGGKEEEEEEEEGGEEEKNAISIAWAIASPAPSRFNSIPQGHVMGFDEDESETKKANKGKGAVENEDEDEDENEEEEEEEEEVMDEGFGRSSVLPAGTANQPMEVTLALPISSPSLPSELDFDFLSGGGGGGGGGKEEMGWMPQQPQQMDGSPEGSALSRAFLQMGLGLPGEEGANSSTTPSPATLKLSNATSKASIMPNKVPLSEEAQAVLCEAALPDFSYMLAKLPVAPPLTVGSSSSSIVAAVRAPKITDRI